jgi:DNA-binding GntR family transcriptional regulator
MPDNGQPSLARADLNTQAYEVLRRWLLTRELAPGDKLNLRVLSERLGVSRSPIQHAITRLVSEGLVSVDPRRGYSVKPLTAREVGDAHDFRMLLELYAADRSVGTASPDQVAGLRSLFEATLALVSGDRFTNRNAYILANQEFHQYVVDLADNPFVSDSYRRLSVHTTIVRTLADPGAPISASRSVEAHREIVAAYEANDLPRARNALSADIENSRSVALEVLQAKGGLL